MMLFKIFIILYIGTHLCQGLSYSERNPALPALTLCEEILLRELNTSKEFLRTGNPIIGREIVRQCEVIQQEFTHPNTSFQLCNGLTISTEKFKVMYDTEITDICWFFNETYNISNEWLILEERKRKWMKINNTALIFTYRAAMNDFDKFSFYLKAISEEIQQLEEAAILRNVTDLFKNSFLANISNPEYKMWLRMHGIRRRIIASSKTELYYIRTPLSSFMLVFGLFANIMVMYLFFKHRSLRTAPNMLLLNLVVVDTLNLVLNLPFGYIVYLLSLETSVSINSITCKLLIYFEQLCTGLCIWSLVAMSILRYKAVKKTFLKPSNISRRQEILIYLASVWVIGFVLAVPTSYAIGSIGGSCRIVEDRTFHTHWNLLFYSVVPVVIVAVFYTLTARRLARSARDMPGETQGHGTHRQARSRGAKVLVTLTIVFAVSYPPLYIYNFLKYWKLVTVSNSMFRVEYIFYYLIYLCSAANPVALYASSSSFREYFNFYFRKWFSRRRKLESDVNGWPITTSSTSESII